MSDVTNAKVKIDKIAYTKNDAEQGNFLPEEQIYADAFEDIEIEDMGNGTYLVTNDGEAIGWTTAEGLELDADTANNTTNKYQEIQQLQQKLTEYTDMHDRNQISDQEYHDKVDSINLKLLQLRQQQYDERFSRGQMDPDEYSQKSKEIKNQITNIKDNAMREAHVRDAIKAQEQNAKNESSSVISSRQALENRLASYTDLHDSGQMSDEAYNKIAAEIMGELLGYDLASYTDLHDSGQMSDEAYNQKIKEIESKLLSFQNDNSKVDTTSDSKDIKKPQFGTNVVAKAKELIGVPYVYGGEDMQNGMDCSGLVVAVYRQLGIELPHNTGAIYNSGEFEVVDSHDNLQPGDLIQFGGADESGAGHIGIYIGNGRVIHEPNSGDVCKEVSLEEFLGWSTDSGPYYLHYKGNNPIQETNIDITSDSKDIKTKKSSSPINVNKTAFGYQAMYIENGKLVIRQFDNLGQETTLSKSRNGFSNVPNEVSSSVANTIKSNNMQTKDTTPPAQTPSLVNDTLKNDISNAFSNVVKTGYNQINQLAKDTVTSQVQDPARRLQAGTINGSRSYNPLNIQTTKNKIDVNDLPYEFNKQTLNKINSLKEKTGAKFGLDISHWQNYPIDYNAVKASGIDYVSIQWGGRGSSGGRYIDGDLSEDTIRKNVHDALDAGLEVGIYTWGQPINEKEAMEEAKWTIEFLNSLPKEDRDRLTIPVMYDYESFSGRSEGISKEQHTANINAFNKVMAENGYKTLTYASRGHYGSHISGNKILSDTNNLWIAEYGANNGYDGEYNIWQYGSDGIVDGINGRVDLNVYYENPKANQIDITSDSKDINTVSTPMSKINVQKTINGYKATYVENGKLVTKEYDIFGRETIMSKAKSKNTTPNEVNIAVADAIKSTNKANAQTSNLASKANAFGSLITNSVNQMAGMVKDTFDTKTNAEAQRLQAAKINGIKTEKGSLVIDNAGKKSRVYMYDKDGNITAITELNTKQKVKDIKYKNGVATATFENGKIQTYKIDKNGNLKAFGFYGGRQNYEDATDAQKQIVDIAKNENGEYSLNTTPDMCWAYVNDIYASAGLIERGHLGSATLEMYEIERNWGLSENFDNIPVGAAVFTDHSAGDGVWEGGYSAGHVAVYIGNGMVRENIGGVVDTPLDQWINTWKNNVPGARVAWGWPGGKDLTETNKLTKVISVENSTKTTNNNSVKKDNNISAQNKTKSNSTISKVKTYKNGQKYHQPQGNGVDYNIGNCGTTSMLQAVNMLEGKNKYTDNIKEWEDMGSYSEEIAVDGGKYIKTWLNNKGLSNDIEVVQAYDSSNPSSKASQNISGTDDLINHLKNGEVCILSAKGPVFKQNDGGYKELDHVVTFYMGDDNKVYCNDPGSNPNLGAGVEYTKEDIDNFFTRLVGSVSLKKKN